MLTSVNFPHELDMYNFFMTKQCYAALGHTFQSSCISVSYTGIFFIVQSHNVC